MEVSFFSRIHRAFHGAFCCCHIALKGLFSQTFDRYKLAPSVVTRLVDFFDGRGESVVDLSLACEAAGLPSFEAEWKGYAQDAGITSEGDKIRLVGWLKSTPKDFSPNFALGPPHHPDRAASLNA